MRQFEKYKNAGSLRHIICVLLVLAVTFTVGCKKDKDFETIIEFEYKDEYDGYDIIFRELLVYIQSGFLELLPTSDNEVNKNQRFVVKSKQLIIALEDLNVIFISKAFPDWPEEDTYVYDEFGNPVYLPRFDRLFRFIFASEQEAENAIEKLNSLPEIVFAERNGAGQTLDNE